MKEITQYKKTNGKSPYAESIEKFDNSIQVRVQTRLHRLQNDNYGDVKKLSPDLFELRCKFGNGVRIYFTEVNNIIVVLLCAGNKSTQIKDIANAKIYLKDFIERNQNG